MKTLLAGLSLALSFVAHAQTNALTWHQLSATDGGNAHLEVPRGIVATVSTFATNSVPGHAWNLPPTLYCTLLTADRKPYGTPIHLVKGDRVEGPAFWGLYVQEGDTALVGVEFRPIDPMAAVRVEASRDGSNWTAVASIPMTTREAHQLFRLRIEPAKLPE